MATRLRIENVDAGARGVMVVILHKASQIAIGGGVLGPGESGEFWVHDGQDLGITELPELSERPPPPNAPDA